MMFVNSSDYLPTTEATGVRIAIHAQGECPFPDTFGYSAPTGAVSSFGIGLVCLLVINIVKSKIDLFFMFENLF